MIITKEWLEENDASVECIDWVLENSPDTESLELIAKLTEVDRVNWANWLLMRIV
jgi:arsenate reductase-like glutaredoxin family protein